jgi:hypothetical protein
MHKLAIGTAVLSLLSGCGDDETTTASGGGSSSSAASASAGSSNTATSSSSSGAQTSSGSQSSSSGDSTASLSSSGTGEGGENAGGSGGAGGGGTGGGDGGAGQGGSGGGAPEVVCVSDDSTWTHPAGEAFEAEIDRALHVVADRGRCRFYATTDGGDRAAPDRLVVLDEEGRILDDLDAGFAPGAMAIAEDVSTLWLADREDGTLRKVDLTTDPLNVGPPITLPGAKNGWFAKHLAVVPGTDDVVVASMYDPDLFPGSQFFNVLDDGVVRDPQQAFYVDFVTPGPDGIVFGTTVGSTDYTLSVTRVGSVEHEQTWFDDLLEPGTFFTYGRGRLFVEGGRVVDVNDLDAPTSLGLVGPVVDALTFFDDAVYGVAGVGDIALTKTDAETLDEVGSVTVEAFGTSPWQLATTNARTFAFLTFGTYFVHDPF